MRIGLVNVDRTSFPNIALGKIAAWHRLRGDAVEWADPMFGEYDRVYMSKIFRFTPDCADDFHCETIRGGTGYDAHLKLPEEIDTLQPDYSIFPNVGVIESFGFITRGCPNKCPWCIVPEKEGGIKAYMTIDEITMNGLRPIVTLMDNNILACSYGIEQLERIAHYGYRIDLNQGNSARLVDANIAHIFADIRWRRDTIRFAADTWGQISEVEEAMRLIDSAGSPKRYTIYTIIHGDIESCYKRLSHFRDNPRVSIVAQPYRNPTMNNPVPNWQRDMARWANRHELYKSCDFRDFKPRKGFCCSQYFTDNDKS